MPSDYLDDKRRSLEQAALSKVVASNAFQRDAIIEFLDRFDIPNAITKLRHEPRENAVLFANLAFVRHFGLSRSSLLLSSAVDFVRARSRVLATVRTFINTVYLAGRSRGVLSTYTSDRRRFRTQITSYRFRGYDNDDYALSFVEPMSELTRGRG
jgi:hypothetical protein